MVKKKVAVALSDWLLDEVDARARRSGLSRSALVQEATAEYLSSRRSREESETYRAGATAALEDMRRIADEREADGSETPSSLERLRALRDADRASG